MAKYKYKRVSNRTLAGLKEAESLKKKGWTVISVSPVTIIFEKKISHRR